MAAELDPDARDRLLDAIVANPKNVSAAARASGYSRMHVYRLMKDKAFVEMLERRRAEAAKVEDDRAKANDPAKKDEKLALETLRAIVGSERAEDKDRIAAAKALLAHHGLKVKATRPGPATAPPPAAVIKVLPGSGVDEAAKWLEAQGT